MRGHKVITGFERWDDKKNALRKYVRGEILSQKEAASFKNLNTIIRAGKLSHLMDLPEKSVLNLETMGVR